MICQRKQIQKRNFNDYIKTPPQPTYNPHALWQKKPLPNHTNQYSLQKNYGIDPWHIKSNSRFEEMNPKMFAQISSAIQSKTIKFSSFVKNTNNAHSLVKEQQSFGKLLEVTKIIGSPFISLEMGPPAKIDMLECSMRFEEYQQQKAEQIKSIYMSKIMMGDQKKTSIKSPRHKNFIKRNIKYAFQIQNGRNDKFVTFQKNKTIQETKQQLIINRQKLQQSSKQIFKLISMKDQKPYHRPRPKSQTQNPQNNLLSSIWNLSYIQRTPNPQFKPARKSHSTITQWKKILNNRNQSQDPKAPSSDHKNSQNAKKTQNFNEQKKTTESDQGPKKMVPNSRKLSKKLARMWKVKNKSTLVIPSSSELSSTEEKLSQNDVHLHTRIHSMTFRGQDGKYFRKTSRDQFQSIEPQGFTQFQNIAISKIFGVKSEKISRKQSISLTKNESGGNFPQRERGRKIKPHESGKRFMSKNFCLEGSICEMSQPFVN